MHLSKELILERDKRTSEVLEQCRALKKFLRLKLPYFKDDIQNKVKKFLKIIIKLML